jgi:glycosyltransferase involved in cell wall biosynthesis
MVPPTDAIVTYHSVPQFPTGELLEQCLATLVEHTKNIRIIVVDDASDIPGAQFLDNLIRKYPNALLVRTGFQRWFTRAVNLGLSLARTERVCVLNSDMVFGPGWLEEMYDVWAEVEKTGKVGLVGSLQSDPEPRRYQISVPADYVTGHAWVLSMQAMKEVSVARGNKTGVFLDESTPGNIHIHSDVEICWLLHNLGWQCVKSFKSAVGHIGGRSWGHNIARVQSLRLEDVNERYQ